MSVTGPVRVHPQCVHCRCLLQDQYVFIHSVLLERIESDVTEVTASDLSSYLSQLELRGNRDVSLLEKQHKASCPRTTATPSITPVSLLQLTLSSEEKYSTIISVVIIIVDRLVTLQHSMLRDMHALSQ